MEFLEIISAIILLALIIIIALLVKIERWASIMVGIEPIKEDPAKVSDPFQKPKEIFSSTSHIIVPKTPTEIRNQNFKKIKEGVEYGDIRRDD
jgi:hypothetical protein